MTPRRRARGRDGEAATLDVACRRRIGETDDAAFAIQIQAAVSNDHRALANASITPRERAAIEFQRREDAARKTVNVITDKHRARMVIAHFTREVDLARGRDI